MQGFIRFLTEGERKSMRDEERMDETKKAWSPPELTAYGNIQELTNWFCFGTHTELFGGQRKTPIDWGLDETGSG